MPKLRTATNAVKRPARPRRRWRTPDALWAQIAPLLPPRKPHPLGCHNPRVDDRRAMDASVFRLRTGCQWNALSATGLEWRAAGVFRELWRRGLTEHDALQGITWSWLAADGAMTKAPLGGGNTTGRNPRDRGKQGTKRSMLTEASGVPIGVAVAGANRHDVMLLAAALASIPVPRPRPTARTPQGVCLDKAYDITWVYRLLVDTGFTPHVRGIREDSTARRRGTRARRWVVERTHSWLNRFRGCSCAGPSRRRTTRARSTSRVRTSRSRVPACWDRIFERFASQCTA
jgi:transposase